MQAVEACPQDKPLKEVLLTLGLPESKLTDLHNVEGVEWRLNLQSGQPFDSFCCGCWGVAVSHFWEETDRKGITCNRNLSTETTSVGPRTTSGGLSTEGWLQSGGDPAVEAP